MSKEAKYIIPVKKFPYKEQCVYLTQDDKELVYGTFSRLDEMCHSKNLLKGDVEEILLLLTTLRNRIYVLNAMYYEITRWITEGQEYTGLLDAIDELRASLSGKKELIKAGRKAAVILEGAAYCLNEYEKKRTIFYERYLEVHSKLEAYCNSINNPRERKIFYERFVKPGNGPTPDDFLEPPLDDQYDPILNIFNTWFNVAKPLTGLMRTYVSEVLECAPKHEKPLDYYLKNIRNSLEELREYECEIPEMPPAYSYDFKLLTGKPIDDPAVDERVSVFIEFCNELYISINQYLFERIKPGFNKQGKFPLNIGKIEEYLKRDKIINAESESKAEASVKEEGVPVEKVSVLFLASNPKDQKNLNLDKECHEIRKKIGEGKYRESIELQSRFALQTDDLQRELLNVSPHIVHFSGHGTKKNEILLVNESDVSDEVSLQALVSLIEILKENIKGVVMNACYSEQQARELVKIVDFAIGMNSAIGDEAAIVFAGSFYRGISFNKPIKVAFDLGLNALDLGKIPESSIPRLHVKEGIDISSLKIF